MAWNLSDDELGDWRRDGFVMRRGCFDAGEVARLLEDAELAIARCREANAVDRAQYFVFADASGRQAMICAGLDHSGTAFEAMCRDPRLVDPAMQLFGERQYVHHAKLMNKRAFEGTAWLWHQDYGYWQDMGAVRPEMLSAMVFLDRSGPDNGGLLVLPGSHRGGRLPHRTDGDTGGGLKQTYLPAEAMRELCRERQPLALAAEPGDVLLFDCNLAHASGHNCSPRHRRSAIVAFNADANRPPQHRGWPLVSRGNADGIRGFRTREAWSLQGRPA
jgi:ectoine hydroxylase